MSSFLNCFRLLLPFALQKNPIRSLTPSWIPPYAAAFASSQHPELVSILMRNVMGVFVTCVFVWIRDGEGVGECVSVLANVYVY